MDQQWKNIVGLDLKSVRIKFAAKRSWWWHLSHKPARIESEYRQFLFLVASNPEKTVLPWSADVDDFWQQHILDTRKYAADCASVAGRLIQRNPHWAEKAGARGLAFAETRKLYVSSFGGSARKRRRAAGETDYGADMPMVFNDSGERFAHGYHGHHGGHHGGAHHGDGHQGSADHGGGGHGGHSCGGHSSCGGHGGH